MRYKKTPLTEGNTQTCYKLSPSLVSYLYSLKINERNEVYETLLLMLLHKDFRYEIEKLIKEIFSTVSRANGEIHFQIGSSKEYEHAVDLVCASQYFIKKFTGSEIRKRRTIALNLIVEIATKSIMDTFLKKEKIATSLTYHKVTFPTIDHELFSDNGTPKIKLIFNEDTSLSEIERYLKKTLELRNNPKKKKMSLGQSFRMLQVENEIRLENKKQKHEYIEQLIARVMKERYGKKLSMEAVGKSIQRIRQIERQINMPSS